MTLSDPLKFKSPIILPVLLLFCLFGFQDSLNAEKVIILKNSNINLIGSVTLASDIPGLIKEVNAKEGSKVPQDTVVVQLRDDSARARMKVFEEKAKDDIDVQYSKKAWEVSKVELNLAEEANRDSVRRLGEGQEVIPLLEVTKLKLSEQKNYLQIKKSEHELNISKLEWDEAKIELQNYQIKSPYNGIVTEILKHPGEAVRQGEPILEMVNLDTVRIEGKIPFSYIDRVEEGQKIIIQNATTDPSLEEERVVIRDLPGKLSSLSNKNQGSSGKIKFSERIFQGKITFIDVKVDPSADGAVTIWAEVENQKNLLREGLYAEMVIPIE